MPAALILAVGGVSAAALQRAASTASRVQEAEDALHAVERIASQVSDAVIDARGYALTGDSVLQGGTERQRVAIRGDLRVLESLVRAEPMLAPGVRSFRTAVERRLDLTDTLRTWSPRRRRAAPAAFTVQVRSGSFALDTMRTELDRLEAEVDRALARRQLDDAQLQDYAMAVLLGGSCSRRCRPSSCTSR